MFLNMRNVVVKLTKNRSWTSEKAVPQDASRTFQNMTHSRSIVSSRLLTNALGEVKYDHNKFRVVRSLVNKNCAKNVQLVSQASSTSSSSLSANAVKKQLDALRNSLLLRKRELIRKQATLAKTRIAKQRKVLSSAFSRNIKPFSKMTASVLSCRDKYVYRRRKSSSSSAREASVSKYVYKRRVSSSNLKNKQSDSFSSTAATQTVSTKSVVSRFKVNLGVSNVMPLAQRRCLLGASKYKLNRTAASTPTTQANSVSALACRIIKKYKIYNALPAQRIKHPSKNATANRSSHLVNTRYRLIRTCSSSSAGVTVSKNDPATASRSYISRAVGRSLRLLRKSSIPARRYCVFFNRTGVCRRGARCPFLHDKSKVAVCRSFLRKNCTKGNECPLSHQADPSKMPVCNYFLRGRCRAEGKCDYRHVRTNPLAPICVSFRNGYCPDGVKCKKQHVLAAKSTMKRVRRLSVKKAKSVDETQPADVPVVMLPVHRRFRLSTQPNFIPLSLSDEPPADWIKPSSLPCDVTQASTSQTNLAPRGSERKGPPPIPSFLSNLHTKR